ncbi:MAG TPA: PAS domain-containing protein [Anaerolinea thermolimosa]|uniref:histidine kinase n=1 Tax=Anaerolinea thermolimosa TaxID=229919 RepID=A0A3D1JHF6_9CHLR|nr:ATP-binding protein [Anaerolinea thermolimosa]GAP07169.1 protein containing PAS domain S-box [Anaerolinea thermolimosa]HCE18009.1 PAS domain-containing protein [Anaerolinea thermolimosa]
MLGPLLPDFRVRQRDYLLEIARAITQELDLGKLLNRILRISVEMLAGQAGFIALRERAGWHVVASQGIPTILLRMIEQMLAEVVEEEDPEQFELPQISHMADQLAQQASLGLLSGIGLPLVTRKRVLGVIIIFRSYTTAFSANDQALLSSFANQAAIAVQNAQLYAEANEERQRLNTLLDSLSDGILILAANNTIERCNPAFARMLNLPRQALIGRRHEDVIRWERPPQGMTLEQAESGGWPLTPHAYLYVEGDIKVGDDLPPLPVGITYVPLIGENGRLRNIICTVRDITKFRQAEELKSTFISVISHELKTPVALIKGYVSTLRRDDAQWDPEVIQDSLEVIEEEADRLAGMIENLLEASRLQAGGLSLKRSDVSLPRLAARIAERMQTQTTSHTIQVDFPEDFPIIFADENRLEQVLTNLIGNAIKYAPGGIIRIHGEVRPQQVIVCVSDQGPGVAAEDIPHIFDRFYRAPDVARQTKGAGLGLYLAKAIVEEHGGRIWVDNVPGQGARFCFSLPRE